MLFLYESFTIYARRVRNLTIDVNYKNKKRYKTAKYPMHQSKFWTGLIWLLSRIALIGKDYRV